MSAIPRAKQSLGQNFLVDENMARKIVDAISPQPDEILLEIGPGMGMITRYLLPRAKRLYAVEIDQRFYENLLRQFGEQDNFTLIESDFLKFDIDDVAADQKIRVVGNIPYNITSPILFNVIEKRLKVTDLTLLVQKEVGMRVVSSPNSKDYGILAILSQSVADVKRLLNVPPTVFQPRPSVDSALIQWRFTDTRAKLIKDELFFKTLVKQAFGKRRKMLRNSLSEFSGQSSLDFTRRPEQLSVDEWIQLANELTDSSEAGLRVKPF